MEENKTYARWRGTLAGAPLYLTLVNHENGSSP